MWILIHAESSKFLMGRLASAYKATLEMNMEYAQIQSAWSVHLIVFLISTCVSAYPTFRWWTMSVCPKD